MEVVIKKVMTDTNNNHVKILFRFYSDVFDEWTVSIYSKMNHLGLLS
jgi:hypothetical protein